MATTPRNPAGGRTPAPPKESLRVISEIKINAAGTGCTLTARVFAGVGTRALSGVVIKIYDKGLVYTMPTRTDGGISYERKVTLGNNPEPFQMVFAIEGYNVQATWADVIPAKDVSAPGGAPLSTPSNDFVAWFHDDGTQVTIQGIVTDPKGSGVAADVVIIMPAGQETVQSGANGHFIFQPTAAQLPIVAGTEEKIVIKVNGIAKIIEIPVCRPVKIQSIEDDQFFKAWVERSATEFFIHGVYQDQDGKGLVGDVTIFLPRLQPITITTGANGSLYFRGCFNAVETYIGEPIKISLKAPEIVELAHLTIRRRVREVKPKMFSAAWWKTGRGISFVLLVAFLVTLIVSCIIGFGDPILVPAHEKLSLGQQQLNELTIMTNTNKELIVPEVSQGHYQFYFWMATVILLIVFLVHLIIYRLGELRIKVVYLIEDMMDSFHHSDTANDPFSQRLMHAMNRRSEIRKSGKVTPPLSAPEEPIDPEKPHEQGPTSGKAGFPWWKLLVTDLISDVSVEMIFKALSKGAAGKFLK